ncbi:MAG: hypothetical protein II424_07120, partial [Bacteroidales bacterium]|nr:hypothetical protein [Bacteroidales bacterium]
EPLNSEGFKKITYNVGDQKNTELLVPLFHNIPKDTPYIATHVWPSQAAIHAGMTHVVNAIPDNWPMGLHLSEGAIHTVQTPFAYVGYKTFDGFDKKPLKGMKDEDLKLVGAPYEPEMICVDRARMRKTFSFIPYMRSRFTNIDIVYRLGLMDELTEKLFGKGGIWEVK